MRRQPPPSRTAVAITPRCRGTHTACHPPCTHMHAPAVFLFGLFCLLKYFPNLDIQSLLSAYFWLLGSVSLVGVFAPSLRTLVRVWGWGKT